MQIGFVGLGKMGGNMVHRIHRDSDHQVVAFDLNEEHVQRRRGPRGAAAPRSLEDLVEQARDAADGVDHGPGRQPDAGHDRPARRAARRGRHDHRRRQHASGTTTSRRAAALDEQGIRYVDVGTSGGVWGLEVGYCMMVGGHEESVEQLAPILDVLAPPDGWRHFGDAGAGHFVKMIHNGIEYGIMQAYAEGFEVMHKSRVPDSTRGGLRALEPRLGRPLVAARAGREGVPRGGQRPRGAGRQRVGLRRGPLDAGRRDRPRRPDAGDRGRAVRALLLAQGGRVHRTRCWPRCATSSAATRSSVPPGRASDRAGLRPHRRPARAGRRQPARRGARAAPGRADDDGHLRRLGRPRQAQAPARALQPRARGRAARALQPDRRRARASRPTTSSARSRASRSATTRAASPTGRCSTACSSACTTCRSRSTTARPTASSARRSTSSTRTPASRWRACTTSRPRPSSSR